MARQIQIGFIRKTAPFRFGALIVLILGGSAKPGLARADTPAPSRVSTETASPAREGSQPNDLVSRLRDRVARPGGLTADEAARRAVSTSTEDRARKADVDVADSDVDRTKVDYYPRLTVTARYTRLSPITPPVIPIGPGFSFPIILDQYLAQANVTVPLSDYLLRIGQSHDAAVLSRDAAQLNKTAARRAVAAETKIAYYTWARARLGEAVTEQSVAQAMHNLELSRALRDAGRAFQADVLRAESLVASAELANVRMQNAAALAEDRLRTVMHDSSGSTYEIGEDLLAPLDSAGAGEAETLYREALRQRPELRALERTDASLRSQREAAHSRALPRLDAFGNAYMANPSPRVIPQTAEWRATWDVGVQLTWSPNDIAGADAATRAVDAQRKKMDANRASLSDSMRDEIAGAVSSWREAHSAAETADRGLTAAEEGYRVRQELFELGRGTSAELIDAESDVLRARLEMIQARVDARVAKVRLEHAVGRDASGTPE
jgi:outer membrane protein